MIIETGTDSVRWLVEPLTGVTGSQRERERALAYALLCRLVGTENLRLEHNDQGTPYLPSHPGLHISISHCRTAVAVAVSDRGPVGIDVECRRRIGEGLVQRVCTSEEQRQVDFSDDPVMAFLRLWTRKEAVLKCRGTGIKGFGSMVTALTASDLKVVEISCEIDDTVAALAFFLGSPRFS